MIFFGNLRTLEVEVGLLPWQDDPNIMRSVQEISSSDNCFVRSLLLQHLYERAWYAVTETCLAMTIFKDEFDTRFVVMFTVLLFLKVFHWLCQDRVDSVSARGSSKSKSIVIQNPQR